MQVAEILADKGPKVVTVRPDITVSEAARILKTERIGALVVCDAEGRVEGMFSERDIVRALAEHGTAVHEMKIAGLMTREVVTAGTEDRVVDLMRHMTMRRIRHLPIVENGELLGIISIGDVVKNRLAELESETDVLRDYITGTR